MAGATDKVFLVDGASNGTYLGRTIEVTDELGEASTIEDALQAVGYRRPGIDVPNLGLSASTYWARTAIQNNTGVVDLVINIGHPDIDHIEVYQVGTNGTIKFIGLSGLSNDRTDRVQRDAEQSFSFSLAAGQRTYLYFKLRSTKQLSLPISISTPKKYSDQRMRRNLLLGGYIGIMLVMALYNLFIFISMRDLSYLLYVVYIVSVALTQLAFTGIAPFYIWPEWTWFSQRATVLLTITTAILAAEFMIVFIRTRYEVPRLHKYVRAFYPVFFVIIALLSTNAPYIAYKATQIISGAFATYLIVMVVAVCRSGSRQAWYFLMAWSGFLVGTVLFVLKDMGLLPYNEFTVYTMPVGSAIEGVLLSFGLADRINILRRDKERSQAEALAVLQENERLTREQNVLLEQKVKQRTAALQESNDTLKRTQAQLVNAEKMASLGQLTAGIAHEINNPINFISSNVPPLRRNMQDLLEVLQRYQQMRPGDGPEVLAEIRALEQRLDLATTLEEMEDIVASIAEGSSRTAEIVRGLRNFSRLDEDDLKEADLNEGIRSTLAVLAPQYRDKVAIELDLQELPKVECFPGKVNQVFMNIITNAIQATVNRPGDRPRVVHVRTARAGDRALVSISDNGVGMTSEVIERIYDPFFTTKPVGEGTGLGMAIVYGIVQEHQGDIRVESSPGIGTTFHLELPVRHLRQQSSPAEAA
ncbi:MAG: 7TM diverse intracellular signaling domain-containing protein [Flavobacteriales bacterium]